MSVRPAEYNRSRRMNAERNRSSWALVAVVIASVAIGAVQTACAPLSDSASVQRAQKSERERGLEAMRDATKAAPAGQRMAGKALTAQLSGRTHVFVSQTKPGGNKKRYVEQKYYRADGRLIYVNTEGARVPDESESNYWRVEGERLCAVNVAVSTEERCYTIAVLANGNVQYFIAEQGSEYDGLLSLVTDEVRDGAPLAP